MNVRPILRGFRQLIKYSLQINSQKFTSFSISRQLGRPIVDSFKFLDTLPTISNNNVWIGTRNYAKGKDKKKDKGTDISHSIRKCSIAFCNFQGKPK